MPIFVVFISGNDSVIETVAERRAALIPSDMRAKGFEALGGEEVALSAYKVAATSVDSDVLAHISGLDLCNASGVIILADNNVPDLIDRFGDVFSVNSFETPAYGDNIGNIITAILAKALRAFRHYKNRFDDLKYQQILRVPLQNFVGAEIGDMRVACHDMISRPNFGRELDSILERFRRQRQKPKKASSHPTTYLVDDDSKHFNLGHEVHAQADTAIPPHNYICIWGNAFRFGRAFDGRRHFNVSRDQGFRMDGNYPDCHSAIRPGGGVTHLNMFTNNFF